jgi:hypothetical protein
VVVKKAVRLLLLFGQFSFTTAFLIWISTFFVLLVIFLFLIEFILVNCCSILIILIETLLLNFFLFLLCFSYLIIVVTIPRSEEVNIKEIKWKCSFLFWKNWCWDIYYC